MGKDLKRNFIRKNIQMANKFINIYTSSVIKDMQIKATMRYHYMCMGISKLQILARMRRNWITHTFLTRM